MQRHALKLAGMAAAAVVLAMVAAAIAFNLFIGWKVESDATADLEYALELNESAAGTGRSPNYLRLDATYGIVGDDQVWASAADGKLASWFSRHPSLYTVQHVAFDGWACYAMLGSLQDYYFESDAEFVDSHGRSSHAQHGYFIAYIDTAGEQALIDSVNMAFALIGLIGAALAAVAGYAAGRRIERAQEAQKLFYENMSHDLKTPLAAIRGYAEGARGGVVEAPRALAAIERETEKMTASIDEILGLSRLEAGAVSLRLEPVTVSDFVQDCLMPFEGVVRSRGIEVQLDLDDGTIQADVDLLEHALGNVLSNAVRHAASSMRVRYDGRELSVWNDGAVPSADQLPQLFDRFYAGDGGSTGVGLAFAREIADLHGFHLTARLEDGGLAIAFAFSS